MNPYQQTIDEVLAEFKSSQRGLNDAEARRRLEQNGPNQLAAPAPVPAWRKFLAQFQDVLVILLLLATAISLSLWLYERDSSLPY
jgi:P-type Ca2+ transporter type 2C